MLNYGNSEFDIKLDAGAIVGLRRVGDAFDTEYILPGKRLGDVFLRYRKAGEEGWREVSTAKLAEAGGVNCELSADGRRYDVTYVTGDPQTPDLLVRMRFDLDGGTLSWTLELENAADQPLEIGDLVIPFPMNTAYAWDKPPTESVFRHSFISGYGSYMFWMRSNSVGPYLTMTPLDNTKLEYFDAFRGDEGRGGYRAYIHSAAEGAVARGKGCKWRQPNTSLRLAPKGSEACTQSYGFRLQWAADYDAVRQIVYDEGKIDVHVVPGMTVPCDLFARFALRTKQKIRSVEAEFPASTEIEFLGSKGGDTYLYQVRFSKLGENLVTVKYGEGRHTFLEFFCTEPVETLIKKRAAFIARCQHRDPSQWYNGLISEWNMETKVLLGPDNYDRIKGWRIYEVTCDDPGLCKPAFLAAKNAEYPDQDQVEALDYYIEHFVWGGLQCTTDEEYPYAIYGIPDWKTNRQSDDPGPQGRLHIWRIYDYPHVVLLYLSMYKIAKRYPHIKTYLERNEYLKRAYGTALAMFTIPAEVGDWPAYQTGLYNELVIENLINELFAVGMDTQGYRLRKHWERKVKFFVSDKPALFGSEYPFDSTGFESTHAFANYALKHADKPGEEEKSGIPYDNAVRFLEEQIAANIFCRGWLEPAYYLLGSDYRGSGSSSYTLSYMSQMGGWSILDYALYHSDDPIRYLRLGYASYLSSWALMNTGTPESSYGYWYPGKENDGGAGGGFEPAPYGQTWLEQDHHRGSWYYACEIDLGYCGALRGAATILADDPLFGMFCFGGAWEKTEEGILVLPKDGVRKRFHAILAGCRLHVLLDSDRFSASSPIVIDDDLSALRFVLESDNPDGHVVNLSLSGLPPGGYSVQGAAGRIAALSLEEGQEAVVELPVPAGKEPARFAVARES